MTISEAQLIEVLKSRVLTNDALSLGFQDDCARLGTDGPTLITTDSLIEDIHFRRAAVSARDLGWKTLAVNLSDLASKGASPVGFFLNWSLPKDLREEWINEFAEGLNEAARFGNCPLLGGDTTGSAGPIALAVMIAGTRSGRIPWRTQAQAGDVLVTTGTLGLSALGLSVQEGEWEGLRITTQARAQSLKRHHRPVPRLQEGAWLADFAHAMMDLSDGLHRDVPRLAKASNLVFQMGTPPLAAELRALCDDGTITTEEAHAFALYGGEDYELLAALPAADAPRICTEYVKRFGSPLHIVGDLVASKSSASSDGSLRVEKSFPRFPTLGFGHFEADREGR